MATPAQQYEILGADSKVVSETQTLKIGEGRLQRIITTATSSGTLKVIDGTESGAAATGKITSSGACAPADYAKQTLTSNETNVSDGDTVKINTTTYRFKTTPAQAYDVKIGDNAAKSLENLKAAINLSGTGVEYHSSTTAHTTVIASTLTSTTLLVVARIIGTAANSYETTDTAATLSWGAATMAGGADTAAATITIGEITYIATKTLAETSGLTPIPYQVLWKTSEAVFLDNLKAAINGAGTAGTTYSTGTLPHSKVIATTNSDTEQTVQSRFIGTAQNSIATSTTLANYSWGKTTIEGGTGATGKILLDTYTPAAGSEIDLGDLQFDIGLSVVVGGTSIAATFIYK